MNQHPRNEICNETPQSELWSGICVGYWAPAVPGRGLASGGGSIRMAAAHGRPAQRAKVDTATKWGNSMSNSGQLG